MKTAAKQVTVQLERMKEHLNYKQGLLLLVHLLYMLSILGILLDFLQPKSPFYCSSEARNNITTSNLNISATTVQECKLTFLPVALSGLLWILAAIPLSAKFLPPAKILQVLLLLTLKILVQTYDQNNISSHTTAGHYGYAGLCAVVMFQTTELMWNGMKITKHGRFGMFAGIALLFVIEMAFSTRLNDSLTALSIITMIISNPVVLAMASIATFLFTVSHQLYSLLVALGNIPLSYILSTSLLHGSSICRIIPIALGTLAYLVLCLCSVIKNDKEPPEASEV